MRERLLKLSGPLALVLVAIVGLLVVLGPAEEPVERSYSCPVADATVYVGEGCTKFYVKSGGEIEVQSGAILDVQSGSTFNVDEDITLENDESISNDSDGTIALKGNVDVTGTLQYGADDLRPLGFDGSSSYEVYFGSASSVTQTQVTSATHNMTTAVDWAICYVSDPDEDAGDPFLCVPTISGTGVTFQAVQDDGEDATTAATKLYYLIVGR